MLIRSSLALLLAHTLTACGGGLPPLATPLKAETTRPGYTTRDMRATIDMTVSGDSALRVTDQPAKLRIVEILGGDNPVNIWFFSISPAEPVALPDGRTILFSADLSPGIYEGPGTYSLSDEAGTSVGGVPGPGSGAYVQFIKLGTPPEIQRYDRFGRPCNLEVGEEVRTGRVRCPELLTDDGTARVSLSWDWRLVTVEDP